MIKKNFFKLFLISLVSTFFIIYSNINRPDAALYHLPYVSYLNEHKIIFGLNFIHFRFALTSINQYLSAINYNYFFGINGISVPLSIFSLTIIFYFWERVIFFIKEQNFTLEFFFILFASIFISYKMNRYSGYGNDNTTHLLYFFLISLLLNTDYKKNFDLISFIVIFIFLNKNSYILTLLIPVVYFFKNKININKIEIIKKLFAPYTLMLFLWLLKNIIISGCIIYPLTKTCFTNIEWSEKKMNIKKEAIAAEAWAKAWPQYNGDLSQKKFNKNFNWVEAWSKTHLKKIIIILTPYILFLAVISLLIIFSKNKKNFLHKDNDLQLLILLNVIFVIIFFLKFPLLRYGTSYLISLIILLFLSCIKKFNLLMINKLSKILIIFIFTIFSAKQLVRINNNIEREYLNKPWPNIYSLDDNLIHKKNEFQKFEKLKIYYSDRECAYSKAICGNYKPDKNFKIKKLKTYYFINLEN